MNFRTKILAAFDRLAARGARHVRLPPLLSRRNECFDILDVAALAAALDSANYYREHMLTAKAFATDIELLAHAVESSPKTGMIMEFGVATGRTISAIASTTDRPIYGFDSFEGLPEDWRTGIGRGYFAGEVPTVPDSVHLVKGWFSDTLPGFLQNHRDDVALLHIDCDLYSSTKLILDALAPRIGVGAVIVFDEYFNYPGWREHEFKAFQEFITSSGMSYRYDSFVPSHMQVCVLIK